MPINPNPPQVSSGDTIPIQFTPSNSTPATEAHTDNVNQLTAHLKGIDTAIGGKAASNHTHASLPSSDQKDALGGTSGTPSSTNKYVTNADARIPNTVTVTETGDLSAAQVTNSIIQNYGQGADATYTLPAAASNYSFTFVVGTGTYKVLLKPQSGEIIILNGVALTASYSVVNTVPAVGDCITFFTVQTGSSAYKWIAITGVGAWANNGS